MEEKLYNIFKNDFFDTAPLPKWAFTVEFFLSDDLNQVVSGQSRDYDAEAPEILKSLIDKLREKKKSGRIEWMDKLQKSISKIPIKHPEHTSANILYFPGYEYAFLGRFNQNGTIEVEFNDNAHRDIRCILEQLMNFDGLRYRREPETGDIYPSLPSVLRFDMLVRIMDPGRVNQYDPTDGYDEVAEKGTVMSFYFDRCYVSKLSAEKNSYESTEKTRTVTASIKYVRMIPLDGDTQL